MSTAHAQQGRHRRRGKRGLLALPVLLLTFGIIVAAIAIAWLLWPRWPAPNVSVDVPAFPITVQGTTFNVPPNAIRLKGQRKPGTQERLDLVFMWPSLQPPEDRPAPVASSKSIDRIFLTIAASDNSTRPPLERFKTIYPRYLDENAGTTEGGLVLRPFREGTPYQGEELLHEAEDAARFLVRCTRDRDAAMIGMCLYERRIGGAELTFRFPREWLADWQAVRDGIERLVADLRISGG